MQSESPSQKRYTCQVTLALAARLEALFELHPQAERSTVLADLLTLGLAQVESKRSARNPAGPEFQPDALQPIYLLTGPFEAFHGLVQKHHLALESALNDNNAPQTNSLNYRLNLDE